MFDGVNDYVDIGLANYDFHNSISYVVYLKILTAKDSKIIGNWEAAGGGIGISNSINWLLDFYNGKEYIVIQTSYTTDTYKYVTVIGTHDGTSMSLYLDGILVNKVASDQITVSPMPILIGANPNPTVLADAFSNISLKEVMLYDRALTEDEVKTITEGFKRKYS